MPKTNIILDTHTWVWLLNGSDELSPKVVAAIELAAQNGSLGIPAISVWEVAMLQSRGRITLSMSVAEWIEAGLRMPGVELMPLSAAVCLDAASLPGDFHGDPADRMIAATTRVHGCTLFTRDRKMLTYANTGHLRARAV